MAYNSMTEKDFFLLCEGHKIKTLNEAREKRQLMYTIVCGYSDPKKLPSIQKWMPLEGDPKPKEITKESVLASLSRFRSWQELRTVN